MQFWRKFNSEVWMKSNISSCDYSWEIEDCRKMKRREQNPEIWDTKGKMIQKQWNEGRKTEFYLTAESSSCSHCTEGHDDNAGSFIPLQLLEFWILWVDLLCITTKQNSITWNTLLYWSSSLLRIFEISFSDFTICLEHIPLR